jgi:hypothetical protein
MATNPPSREHGTRRRTKSSPAPRPRKGPRHRQPEADPASLASDLLPNSIVTRSAAFIEPWRRESMIAEAAYFLAERRQFDPGHELEDWFTAERQIDAALAHGDAPTLDASGGGEEPATPAHYY